MEGFNWTIEDYVIAGILIATFATLGGLAMRKSLSLAYRAGALLAIGTAIFVFVATGAVGIIGDEGNPANLMYLGVIAMTVSGAIVAGAEARGLVRAMLVAAGSYALVGAIAVTNGLGTDGNIWPYDVIGATIAFSGAHLVAAWLFHQAARAPARA